MLRMGASSSLFLLPTVALLAGCLVNQPDAGDEPNTDPPVDALEIAGHPGLETCTAGMAAADVDAQLEIAAAFRDSLSEIVTCGQLAQGFTGNLILVFVVAAAGGDAHPNGFTYEGDGIYSASGMMDISVHLAADTSFGRAGDRITWDLFDPNNWFTDFTVVASASVDLAGNTTQTLEIEYGGTAPGAELLGVAEGSGRLTIDTNEIGARLGDLQLRSVVVVEEARGESALVWQLESPAGRVGDLLSNTAMLPTELVDVSATNAATGQALVLGEWAISYTTGHGGTTDGTVTFDVTGGAFDYGVTFTYPHRREPDVALHCL